MSITMYPLSVPVFINGLDSLKHILQQGHSYAEQKDIAEEVLLNTRLFPDMLPLLRQIQIACDLATRGGGRLASVDLPQFEDKEQSFSELFTRIDNSIGFLHELSAGQINGSENNTIEFMAGGYELSMLGLHYLTGFVKPNLYFHITTSYNILRHCGVPLSKLDYLGKI